MQRYYRAAKSIRQLNVILLQNLRARLFPAEVKVQPIDADFQAVDELLDIKDEELFSKRPGAILDSFLTLQRHPELKGMSAPTLRALWRHRKRVDAAFRRDPENRARFLAILREPHGVTHELRRMNQYGILGRYIPAYGRIVGQMQHDLYHVYTVDEHILMVIRNLRRFTEAQHAHEYPLCSRLIADFARPEVLYLAALFHDIAKGRGGNHSHLGASDARRFCRQHGLAAADARLVALAGRRAPGDVAHCAEAGHHRPRGRGGVCRQGAHRKAPGRALSADRGRHSRHQSPGLECLEGETA